ncbi:MAG TPA: FkbM family methyltransferase [Candidatus Eisenbacteria bacterium]|nr:FkbM family methyltransferase [Candidatus Eisenbacteria bacterium]
MSFRGLLKRVLVGASGNRFVQALLERNVHVSQILMGIGSGDEVSSSGEAAAFRVLRAKAEPPYCIFDVGSNKGQFLRLALDHVGTNDLSIHGFEPGRETFRVLAGSFEGDPRVRVNNVALGRAKGRAVLHYDRAGSGLASLTKRRLDHHRIDFSQSETVEVDTIDDYCSAHAIDRIHLLKLDIEGHELDALVGAASMFAAGAIDIVTFEFGGCNIDTRSFFRDYWHFFHDARFRLFRIAPSGYLAPIGAYREVLEQFRTTNFIAIAER